MVRSSAMDKQIKEILVCIRLCYSYCNWHRSVQPLLEKIGVYEGIHREFPDIKFSTLDSSLANIRRYDEFLRPADSRTRPDDIKADSFENFSPTLGMLDSQERDDINKRLMHLTNRQIEEGDWNVAVREMLPKIADHHKEFLDYVKANYPDSRSDACDVESMINDCLEFAERDRGK